MIDHAGLAAVLARVRSENPSTSLFFILRPRTDRGGEDGPELDPRRARMTQEIADEFRSVLADHLEKLTAGREDLQIVDFDPFSDADGNRIERQDASQVPGLSALLAPLGAPSKVEDAELDAELYKALWAYAVVVHLQGLRVAYIRKFLPSKVIRSGGLLKAFLQDGVLTKIDAPVFNFDAQADLLVIGDDVLILQKTLFEQIFELGKRIYEPAAKEALQKIAELRLISDMKGFVEVCANDEKKQKKLADIQQNIPLGEVTFDKLVGVKRDWEVDVELDETARQIVFDARKAWNILKLIGDDHLRSPVTQQRYEVQSKRRVRRPAEARRRKV